MSRHGGDDRTRDALGLRCDDARLELPLEHRLGRPLTEVGLEEGLHRETTAGPGRGAVDRLGQHRRHQTPAAASGATSNEPRIPPSAWAIRSGMRARAASAPAPTA